MKLALIRKKYTPFGGAERYIDSLIEHLIELGHEVHIFAGKWESPVRNSKSEKGALFYHRVPMINGLSVLRVLSFAFNARMLLKKEQFDVIHSFERTLYHDIYRAGDGCHKEWLIQRAKYEPAWKSFLVRMNPLHWSFLWIERQIFKQENTKLVIANSQRRKEEIVRHYGFPPDRIRVIYNGVDDSRFNPGNRKAFRKVVRKSLGIAQDDIVLLFIGSGFERKGLKFAIMALSRMNDVKFKLLVAGNDRTNRYKHLARRLGIIDNVLFCGPTREPEKLYAAADLFVLPTAYEPFSNACLEAMASGIPVVTTIMNGASELIEEGVTGICVDDPSNIEALKEAIQKLLRQGGDGAVTWAESESESVDLRDHITQTIECYKAVLTQYNEDKDSG